ncbi:hypothetical protein Vi05172_g3689 [Venturia inaequalis]|nr:hypothetical protein Vi05172_g3689 [Venturia inaequalis]
MVDSPLASTPVMAVIHIANYSTSFAPGTSTNSLLAIGPATIRE